MTNKRQLPPRDDRVSPVPSDFLQTAYEALRGLAAAYLDRERKDHTLQPTALVHEAYLKLAQSGLESDWKSKSHFQAVAARAMRQILIDHARRQATDKRGGNWHRITLSTELGKKDTGVDILELDDALLQLSELDHRKAQVVELRFFGGLTNSEAAEQLEISPKTAEADWYFARAWLRSKLSEVN